MRLFYAVLLDHVTRDKLSETARLLKQYCKKGNFTKTDNFHITLLFLGEVPVESLPLALSALQETDGADFEAAVEGIGVFMRPGGDIYWMSVRPWEPFLKLHHRLCEAMMANGIEIKKENFRPHITLGRQVVLQQGCEKEEILGKTVERHAFCVDGLALMKSERINGELVYTPVEIKRWKVR